jgi:hypothetical protein
MYDYILYIVALRNLETQRLKNYFSGNMTDDHPLKVDPTCSRLAYNPGTNVIKLFTAVRYDFA